MAGYRTWIPRVEVARMIKELEKHLVFAAHCNREYEGEIRKRGESVTITSPGDPTIYTLEKDGSYTADEIAAGNIAGTGREIIHKGIPDAEEIEGSEILLQVNQLALWHFFVGDLDEKESAKKNLNAMTRERASKKLAHKIDKYIADLIATNEQTKYTLYPTEKTTMKVVLGTADTSTETNQINPLDLIDNIVQVLNERDVTDATDIVCECTPKFWKYLKHEYRDLDTNNSKYLAGRKLGVYNDIEICKTNDAFDDEGNEYVYFRTRDAVTFVNPFYKTKAYEPEKGFADAVKGYTLYEAKVLRPLECVVVQVEY